MVFINRKIPQLMLHQHEMWKFFSRINVIIYSRQKYYYWLNNEIKEQRVIKCEKVEGQNNKENKWMMNYILEIIVFKQIGIVDDIPSKEIKQQGIEITVK